MEREREKHTQPHQPKPDTAEHLKHVAAGQQHRTDWLPVLTYLEVLYKGPRAYKLLIEEGDYGRTLQGAIPEGSP